MSAEQNLPKDVNQYSAKFIDWAVAELQDPAFYEQAVGEIKARLDQFYAQSPQIVIDRLQPKLIRGAQEHGLPFYPQSKMTTEIENEYTDLLGWMLIERWNHMHPDGANSKELQ